MKFKFVIGFVVISILLVTIFYLNNYIKPQQDQDLLQNGEATVTYLPIGDSYTIGNGVLEKDRWPNVVVKHLNEAGVKVQLVGNPAVSGYAVSDAILLELPLVESLKPDFVTVLIGANDNFRETPVEVFETDLKELLDKLQGMLHEPKNIVLITIPDYSKSPGGRGYDAAAISKSIEEYNEVIKSEADSRGLEVADIFPVSQTMTGRDDYISDGLHPSAAGYAKWEQIIYPVVLEALK